MGGIESHCAHLLPRLVGAAPLGQLKLTVLGRSRYIPHKARFQGVEQIALWAPRHPALETIVHTVLALIYARFVLRVDCVHLHGIGPGLTSPLARLFGLSLLFTHHGEDYRRQKWGRVSRLALRLGEVLAVTFAHSVIAVSPSIAKQLKRRFRRKAGRIAYVPNGVPPVDADTAAKPPAVLDSVAPSRFLVTVGRLVPEKGQDLLIEAFRQSGLAELKPPYKLVVVGATDHESDYATRLLAQGGADVVFAGRLTRAEVMALNRKAALFVLPSYHEGLSIAALEAVRAGTPVLLSDITANRDIGLPEHHYFASGSAQALADKLKEPPSALAPPKDFGLDVFDWDLIAHRTLDQFASINRRNAPLLSLTAAKGNIRV